ncbi:hypothetical protein RHECNPAF_1340017 [Rhizobium etli CNPAF512]|nr:hypothetical protein RHECNPAF_1340017 [Rhizobium etli CNPAF512]
MRATAVKHQGSTSLQLQGFWPLALPQALTRC